MRSPATFSLPGLRAVSLRHVVHHAGTGKIGRGGSQAERPPGEAASSLMAKAAGGLGDGEPLSLLNITTAPIKHNSALRERGLSLGIGQ